MCGCYLRNPRQIEIERRQCFQNPPDVLFLNEFFWSVGGSSWCSCYLKQSDLRVKRERGDWGVRGFRRVVSRNHLPISVVNIFPRDKGSLYNGTFPNPQRCSFNHPSCHWGSFRSAKGWERRVRVLISFSEVGFIVGGGSMTGLPQGSFPFTLLHS